MKAVMVARQGGPRMLRHTTVADPVPGEGEVLVGVHAIGVNYRDLHERSGTYPHQVPFVPGRELAGTILVAGPGVRDFAIGDAVACADVVRPGAYAEQAVVPTELAVPVPTGMPLATAAAVLLQGLTADYLCRLTYPVQPGDVAVVHAAAGGTGLLLTQLVKMRGGQVIAAVSSPAKAELVRSVGADAVVCQPVGELCREVHRFTGGRGAAVVFDSVSRATIDQSLACLRQRGHLVLYGRSSGPAAPVDLHELGVRGSLTVHVPLLPDYIATRDDLIAAADRLFEQVQRRRLRVHVGKRFPLAAAWAAHEALQSRKTMGKLLLIPDMHSTL